MFLFPFLKRNNEMRNPLSKFPPISPPNAGKYRHFRPRLHRAVFYFANYAVSKWVFREFRLFFVASEGLWFYILELELELIQTQMAQKPMLRAEVGMRVRCANKASAE